MFTASMDKKQCLVRNIKTSRTFWSRSGYFSVSGQYVVRSHQHSVNCFLDDILELNGPVRQFQLLLHVCVEGWRTR